MALKTIGDLTAETAPAATDMIGVWDVSAGAMRKSTLAQVTTQAGVAAIKASANTFTAAQTIAPATGAQALTITPNGNFAAIVVSAFDNGAGIGGRISLQRNNNASTPAASTVGLQRLDGTAQNIWPDASGLLRIHTAAITNATDTAGTVIGAQTSHVAFKDVAGEPIADADALALLVEAAATVKRFAYKSGAYNGQEFSGVVLDGDELQRYGQDADAEHPAGKSLNIINAIGDIMLALREIERRLTALEA